MGPPISQASLCIAVLASGMKQIGYSKSDMAMFTMKKFTDVFSLPEFCKKLFQ